MANIVPAQTAELEGAGTGNWQSWFDCTIAKSTTQALNGTGSLQISTTAAAWGVQSNNWPGTTGAIVGHEYELTWGFYAPAGISGSAEWRVSWRNDGGTELLRTDVPITLSGAGGWVQSAPVLATPPTGTTRFFLMIVRTAGFAASQTLHADSFIINDTPSGGGPAEATATIPLTLALGVTAATEHQASAPISLSLNVAADSATTHQATAPVDLGLGLGAVADAPAVGAEATAAIPLTLDLDVTSRAVHEATAPLGLSVGLGAVASAPGVGVAEATAVIPLTLLVSATAQTVHRASAPVDLALTVDPVAATGHAATADIDLTLLLTAVAQSEPLPPDPRTFKLTPVPDKHSLRAVPGTLALIPILED